MRHFLDHSEQRGVRQRWLHTLAFITGEPNEFLREIHTRMPIIPPEEDHDAWLSRESRLRGFGSLPGAPNEGVAGQFS